MTPRIAIGIPSGRTWEAEMALSLIAMLANTGAELTICWRSGSQITMQRNQIVQDAQRWGATHLFWLDSDVTAPSNTISELLKHDKPIVGASYCMKAPPHSLNGGIGLGEGRLKPATRLPGGCMLVRMEVYEKLEWPWYFEVTNPEERKIVSEDFSFCDKAIAAGYEIWCDIDLTQRLGHLGSQPVMFALPNDHPDKIR